MTKLEDVYNEWQNNVRFRQAFKKDPLAALKDAGFTLSPDDLEKIQSLIKNDNSNLDDRINK